MSSSPRCSHPSRHTSSPSDDSQRLQYTSAISILRHEHATRFDKALTEFFEVPRVLHGLDSNYTELLVPRQFLDERFDLSFHNQTTLPDDDKPQQ